MASNQQLPTTISIGVGATVDLLGQGFDQGMNLNGAGFVTLTIAAPTSTVAITAVVFVRSTPGLWSGNAVATADALVAQAAVIVVPIGSTGVRTQFPVTGDFVRVTASHASAVAEVVVVSASFQAA